MGVRADQHVYELHRWYRARETGTRLKAVVKVAILHRNPTFHSGNEVKVSRRSVKATVFATNLTMMSNRALRLIFARAADGLPLASRAATNAAFLAALPDGRIDVR